MIRSALSTRTILIISALIWGLLIWQIASNRQGPEAFQSTVSQQQVQSFARQKLASLQQRSFSEGVEICGIIFENSAGELFASNVTEGEAATCDVTYIDEPDMAPIASFHTHGAFGFDYDSEVPSVFDLRSDFGSQIDGYISTPGGRFWRVSWEERIALQICGEFCLPSDPQYRPCPADQIASQYSLETLQIRAETRVAQC